MKSNEYSPQDSIRKCYLVSIIDGSLIDLRSREHLRKKKSYKLEQLKDFTVSLGKRKFQAFDYIEKKYLNKYRKMMTYEDQNYSNSKLPFFRKSKQKDFEEEKGENARLDIRPEYPLYDSISLFKKAKFRLKKIQKIGKKQIHMTKKSILSPMVMVSTMSFNSNKTHGNIFFPELAECRKTKHEKSDNHYINSDLRIKKSLEKSSDRSRKNEKIVLIKNHTIQKNK